ncbi:hypothetical protein ACFU1Q_03570 [Brachybacterium paraconglomeratum]
MLASVLEEPRPREALRGVVEAFWEAQHNGRTDDIERLRRLIELTVK